MTKMSHSRERICVDICNTLADVNKAIEGVFGPVPNPLLFFHPKTPRVFWEKESEIAERIFEAAEPFEGAAEVLNKLAECYEIIYLTARPEWAKGITYSWLEKHGFPLREIVCENDKYSWIKENGAILMFEDEPRHIRKIQTLTSVLIHARPWNQKYEPRFEWGDLDVKQCNFYRKGAVSRISQQVQSCAY